MKLLIAVLLFCLALIAPANAYVAMPCPPAQPGDVAIIVAGQSNAGSYGDLGFQPLNSNTPANDVQIWFGTGVCYPLNDSMAGFTPPIMPLSGGSIWTRFSQLLRDQRPAFTGRLIVVNIAQNGVPITNWSQTGPDYPRIQTAINVLAANGCFQNRDDVGGGVDD